MSKEKLKKDIEEILIFEPLPEPKKPLFLDLDLRYFLIASKKMRLCEVNAKRVLKEEKEKEKNEGNTMSWEKRIRRTGKFLLTKYRE